MCVCSCVIFRYCRQRANANQAIYLFDVRKGLSCYKQILHQLKFKGIWVSSYCFTSRLTQNRSFLTCSSQSVSWLSTEETKPNTTKANIHQLHKDPITQNKHKNLKPGLVAFNDLWLGNGAGLILTAPEPTRVRSRTQHTTTIVLRPFVRDYPGEPVPEETLTHPPSWSSSNLLPASSIYHDP